MYGNLFLIVSGAFPGHAKTIFRGNAKNGKITTRQDDMVSPRQSINRTEREIIMDFYPRFDENGNAMCCFNCIYFDDSFWGALHGKDGFVNYGTCRAATPRGRSVPIEEVDHIPALIYQFPLVERSESCKDFKVRPAGFTMTIDDDRHSAAMRNAGQLVASSQKDWPAE